MKNWKLSKLAVWVWGLKKSNLSLRWGEEIKKKKVKHCEICIVVDVLLLLLPSSSLLQTCPSSLSSSSSSSSSSLSQLFYLLDLQPTTTGEQLFGQQKRACSGCLTMDNISNSYRSCSVCCCCCCCWYASQVLIFVMRLNVDTHTKRVVQVYFFSCYPLLNHDPPVKVARLAITTQEQAHLTTVHLYLQDQVSSLCCRRFSSSVNSVFQD